MINDDDGFDEWLDRVNAAVREIAPDTMLVDWCGFDDDGVIAFYPSDPDDVIDELRASNPEFLMACRRAEYQTSVDNDAAYAYDGDGR